MLKSHAVSLGTAPHHHHRITRLEEAAMDLIFSSMNWGVTGTRTPSKSVRVTSDIMTVGMVKISGSTACKVHNCTNEILTQMSCPHLLTGSQCPVPESFL